MYPLVEETTVWQKCSKANPNLLTLGPIHKSLACLIGDEDLEGVSFVLNNEEEWRHEGNKTYSIAVPKQDIVEAIYADVFECNPRLHMKPMFSLDKVTVPINFGQELGLPMLAAVLSTIRLAVDVYDRSQLPQVQFRIASLCREKRSEMFHQEQYWRDFHMC